MNYDIKIKNKINHILHDNFEVKERFLSNDETQFDSLGLDSLGFADLIVTFEAETSNKIKMSDFIEVKTLNDLYMAATKVKQKH